MMTVGMLLDAIDRNRERDEVVRIIDENGEVEMEAKTRSSVWDSLEEREIDSMEGADVHVIDIWLAAEKEQ